MHEHIDWRKVTYTEHTITLSGNANDLVMPPSPRRIGLLLGPDTTGSTVRYTLAQAGVTSTRGITVPGTGVPLKLWGPEVWNCCNGEIRAQGTVAHTVTVGEWLYGD